MIPRDIRTSRPMTRCERVLIEIERRGLALEPTGALAFRLRGPGVDVMVARVDDLTLSDLEPAHGRRHAGSAPADRG
jgi:hypothetical protein